MEIKRKQEEEERKKREEEERRIQVGVVADRRPLLAFVVLSQEMFAEGSLDGF